MDKEFTVYISASPEMDAECEQIGQVLAGLTQSSRSTIRRTPTGHPGATRTWPPWRAATCTSSSWAPTCAPRSASSGRPPSGRASPTLGYRYAEASPSPAMLHFMRHNRFPWVTYQSPLAFRSTLERTLLRRLLDGTPGFGLDLSDVEQIAARLKELEEQEGEDKGPDERRGAGSGGIILPRP